MHLNPQNRSRRLGLSPPLMPAHQLATMRRSQCLQNERSVEQPQDVSVWHDWHPQTEWPDLLQVTTQTHAENRAKASQRPRRSAENR